MDPRRELQTDRRLWLLFTVVLFVLLGFVDPWGGMTKVRGSFWGHLVYETGRWQEWWRAAVVVTVYAVVLAIPAAVLGWITQATVVVLRTPRSPRPGSARKSVVN